MVWKVSTPTADIAERAETLFYPEMTKAAGIVSLELLNII